MQYHEPVMLEECLEGLALRPGGTYVDVTFGGGGHSKAILSQLEGGRLVVFDQDPDAKAQADEIADDRLIFVAANFRHLKRYLALHKIDSVDGILADLGVSSHQLDAAARGFTFRQDAALDLRMNPGAGESAAEALAGLNAAELQDVLGGYGEVRNAKTLAKALVLARTKQPIQTTSELIDVLRPYAERGRENKYFAQVFQALRIHVNDELGSLEDLLPQCIEVLKPAGRLVVMSYHSLEDRRVKHLIQTGNFQGQAQYDIRGHLLAPLRAVRRKALTASPEELTRNPRARSAKLRIAEKI